MGDATIRDVRDRAGGMTREIRQTLDAIDTETIRRPAAGWPLWKQLYHLLYWLDYWFIDPLAFSPPAFHEAHFMQPDAASPNSLTKAQLIDYLEAIRVRIERYLADITPPELERQTEVRGRTRSRLDMILGQFTHVAHHLGYICAVVRIKTGRSIWSDTPR